MKTETEESLRSSVNHENGDEAQTDGRWKRRQKERIVHFSSVASFASVELTSQTSKYEPVLTEAQAETPFPGRMSRLRLYFRRWCEPSLS